jgi:hypothetical protein
MFFYLCELKETVVKIITNKDNFKVEGVTSAGIFIFFKDFSVDLEGSDSSFQALRALDFAVAEKIIDEILPVHWEILLSYQYYTLLKLVGYGFL